MVVHLTLPPRNHCCLRICRYPYVNGNTSIPKDRFIDPCTFSSWPTSLSSYGPPKGTPYLPFSSCFSYAWHLLPHRTIEICTGLGPFITWLKTQISIESSIMMSHYGTPSSLLCSLGYLSSIGGSVWNPFRLPNTSSSSCGILYRWDSDSWLSESF